MEVGGWKLEVGKTQITLIANRKSYFPIGCASYEFNHK